MARQEHEDQPVTGTRSTGAPSVDPASISVPDDLTQSIDHSPLAGCLTDPKLPDNPIVAVNDAFCALTGFDRSEILGRNCRFLAGDETEPWLTKEITDAVAAKRPVLVEILNYKKDGSPFRNAVMIAPMYDASGDLIHFIGTQMAVEEDERGPSLAAHERAVAKVNALSPRQRQVLEGVAKGLRNKQIAYELGLAEKTVKMHRGILMDRLGLKTSAELVRVAVEAGL